ncbi:MAG: ABC transporter permease [Bacteroidota bacterium]
MWRSYFKTALRTLLKHRWFTALNIAGLAVGLACCLLIGLFVHDELMHDRFHEDADRMYFVAQESLRGGEWQRSASTFEAIARAMEQEIPTVEQGTTVFSTPRRLQRAGAGTDEDKQYAITFADSVFFELFDYPLASGHPEHVLDAPNQMVLSQPVAEALFGNEDPIGQSVSVISYSDTLDCTVTGLLATPPGPSHLTFDAVASLSTLWPGLSRGWGGAQYRTYVQLAPDADPAHVAADFEHVLSANTSPERAAELRHVLVPLTDLYLSDLTLDEGFRGAWLYVTLFGSIALVVLLLALINYMNLATARASTRAQEVGVRKTMGATRFQVAIQFLTEALIVTGVAVVLGLMIAQLALPVFSTVFAKELSFGTLLRAETLLVVFVFSLSVALLAGSYPALYLSGFRASRVLKQEAGGRGSSAWLRRGLVVFQFGVTLVLLVATFVVQGQLQFVQERELGFADDQVLAVHFEGPAMAARHEAIKEAVLQHTGVQRASAAGFEPGRYWSRLGVRPDPNDPDFRVSFRAVTADADYLSTLGLQLKAGRDFDSDRPRDASHAVIVNEATLELLGDRTGLGQTIHGLPPEGNQIVGVLENYHFESLRRSIDPVIIQATNPLPVPGQDYRLVLVRFDPAQVQAVSDHLRTVWADFGAARPPEIAFLDDTFAAMYETERRLAQVFNTFAFVAVLIALLGLLGLTAFAVERRTKEIGIRKVLGATVGHLVQLLSRDFLVLVAVGMLVGAPVAYVAMQRWLEGFAYRIELGPWVFAGAAAAALGVALLAVGVQTVRAALRDPVDALRYE